MVVATRSVPDFRLQINDRDLPAALRASVTSVRYQDGIQAADRVEIGLANVDVRWLQAHIRGLGFQPLPTGLKIGPSRIGAGMDGLFDIDNTVRLSLGYAPNQVDEVFLGEVTGVEASFPKPVLMP